MEVKRERERELLIILVLVCGTTAGKMPAVPELSRCETTRVVDGITNPLRQSHRWSTFTRRTACWTQDWTSESLLAIIVNKMFIYIEKENNIINT